MRKLKSPCWTTIKTRQVVSFIPKGLVHLFYWWQEPEISHEDAFGEKHGNKQQVGSQKFEAWFKAERNKTEVPLEVLLSNDDPTVLCDTLCLYVKVTKKTDGSWIADGWCCSFNNCTSDWWDLICLYKPLTITSLNHHHLHTIKSQFQVGLTHNSHSL